MHNIRPSGISSVKAVLHWHSIRTAGMPVWLIPAVSWKKSAIICTPKWKPSALACTASEPAHHCDLIKSSLHALKECCGRHRLSEDLWRVGHTQAATL